MFIRKMFSFLVHLADQAECAIAVVILKSLRQHILRAAQQHMFSVQFEEIRTLPHKTKAAIITDQDAFILPFKSIGTAE